MNSKFTVVIIPQKTSKVVKFKISTRIFFFLSFLFFLYITITVYVFIEYFLEKNVYFNLDDIKGKYFHQEELISQYKGELDTIEQKIEQLTDHHLKLRKLTSLHTGGDSNVVSNGKILQEVLDRVSVDPLFIIPEDKVSFFAVNSKTNISNISDYFDQAVSLNIPEQWPASGFVVSGFNNISSAFLADGESSGIYLYLGENSSIRAPSDSIVVFAGLNEKFNKFIVLYHSYGITTKYANLEDIRVKLFDVVEKGDIIATTADGENPYFYYQVDFDGIPQNPTLYLQ